MIGTQTWRSTQVCGDEGVQVRVRLGDFEMLWLSVCQDRGMVWVSVQICREGGWVPGMSIVIRSVILQ